LGTAQESFTRHVLLVVSCVCAPQLQGLHRARAGSALGLAGGLQRPSGECCDVAEMSVGGAVQCHARVRALISKPSRVGSVLCAYPAPIACRSVLSGCLTVGGVGTHFAFAGRFLLPTPGPGQVAPWQASGSEECMRVAVHSARRGTPLCHQLCWVLGQHRCLSSAEQRLGPKQHGAQRWRWRLVGCGQAAGGWASWPAGSAGLG
jgi:hypothetical protein